MLTMHNEKGWVTMSIALEYKKTKRTGLLAAFLGGGILAALLPILNMAVRSELYLDLPGSPLAILLNANWKMMAMLNILLILTGACMIYYTEYAENAIQRMNTLPIRESNLFFGKFLVLVVLSIFMLAMETGGIAFCCLHWFQATSELYLDLLKNFGYFFLLLLPGMLLALLIGSACKNMWISLGVGVVCISVATMIPTDNFVLSLFPFSLPFQILEGSDRIIDFVIAAIIEIVLIVLAEEIFLKVRRLFA